MSDEQKESESKKNLRHFLGRIAIWIGLAIVLFVFIIGIYISLAAFNSQFTPITDLGSVLTPILLTGIILIIFGIAAILYPTGPSKDGSWVLMTGPYVR
ncbi:MAG: hypothetical protein ACFFDM_12290 [Candidatus Thorarchaeota archaeon]